jgi:hypothetical protein
MFVLIDKDRLVMLAAAHTRNHIQLVLEVDFPEINSVLCNANDGGSWTGFSREEMDTLYKNTSGMAEAPEYGDAIEQLRAYVLQWTDYHKSEADLTVERQQLVDDGDIPPDDPIQQQINANKMMRANHQAIIAQVEKVNAEHEAKPEVQAEKAVEKQKKAAKPVTAPTQGLTKRVWEIADAVKGANPTVDLKLIRKKVMELCNEEGLNPGTAATQYGRWKNDRGYA